MDQKKLFAVMLGGRAEGCHIELHDVVFTVAESFEDAYPLLVNKWFGIPKRLHIDSYVELSVVDGYEIQLIDQSPEESIPESLYFTNFGGYKSGFFGELHEVSFYVGSSKKEIIKRAKNDLCVGAHLQHCDDNLVIGGTDTHKDVDDVVKVGCVDGWYIQLQPSHQKCELNIQSTYIKLDVPQIIEQASSLSA